MQQARYDRYAVLALMALFWYGVLRQVDLPGLYMDGVNPDYLAAHHMNRKLQNHVWTLPTIGPILLGNLYHGVQNYYAGIPIFKLLGVSVTSIRIAQSLFGAAIVLLLYFLSVRITRNRLISFFAAALLATDIAFLASFRTQFYIILGGETWLFASLLALWHDRRVGYLLSGIFYGLAIYGYFVLGFFLPAMLVLVLAQPNRDLRLWILGVMIGVMPYVAGYLSMMLALGGISATLTYLKSAVTGLDPLSSRLTLWDSIQTMLLLTRHALTNTGNEIMIFAQGLESTWGKLKVWLFTGVFVLALLRIRLSPPHRLLVLLPISFLVFATLLGTRLWAHHYSLLLAIGYLLLAVTAGDLAPHVRDWKLASAASAAAILMIVANLHQMHGFHKRLNQTGGVAKLSNALNRLADDARSTPGTLYAFPEWGFFMPFALLTENRIKYILDTDQINPSACPCDSVAIAYWKAEDTEKYRKSLKVRMCAASRFKPTLSVMAAPPFICCAANSERVRLASGTGIPARTEERQAAALLPDGRACEMKSRASRST